MSRHTPPSISSLGNSVRKYLRLTGDSVGPQTPPGENYYYSGVVGDDVCVCDGQGWGVSESALLYVRP